jgi:simple sugar transport system ATP-binding protein
MRGIWKRFGSIAANKGVDFDLRKGEIHALLGENGAGKSTLMRILYGLYRADAGSISIDGVPVTIRSPRDAILHGIGMVTQHFALVGPMTVTENIILGSEQRAHLDLRSAYQRVAATAERIGLSLNPKALVSELSVGQRQRVEIVKALYREARVLILDEPTAVLVPQEVEQLFVTLRRLRDEGVSVVFISHKLQEVMQITDRVTVMRAGEVVGSADTSRITPSELARMMVGRATSSVTKPSSLPVAAQMQPALRLEQVKAKGNKGLLALRNLSLEVHAGEILGIAGVSGNGQTELAQVVEGVRPVVSGRVYVCGQDVTNVGPRRMMDAGVGRIPEDRHESIVGGMSVAYNMALEHLGEFTRLGFVDRQRLRQHAEHLIAAYQIKAHPNDPIRTLSGGNIQKVILARVLERNPQVIVVSQPTRGLDLSATAYVRSRLIEQRQRGAAILLISEDLDEILELADRVAVIYEGEIRKVFAVSEATPEGLGLLMAGMRD